jgi:hypothetical protein
MSRAENLKALFKRYRWTVEELVYDQKLQEATELVNGTNQPIFQYLCSRLGSAAAVEAAIRSMMHLQAGPRKALAVRKDK